MKARIVIHVLEKRVTSWEAMPNGSEHFGFAGRSLGRILAQTKRH